MSFHLQRKPFISLHPSLEHCIEGHGSILPASFSSSVVSLSVVSLLRDQLRGGGEQLWERNQTLFSLSRLHPQEMSWVDKTNKE